MNRREYTKEFKQEAVALSYRQGGAKAAQSLGIAANMLYRWRREAQTEGSEAFRGKGKLRAEDEEIARLRRELASVQEDNVIYALRSSVVRLINSPTTEAKVESFFGTMKRVGCGMILQIMSGSSYSHL